MYVFEFRGSEQKKTFFVVFSFFLWDTQVIIYTSHFLLLMQATFFFNLCLRVPPTKSGQNIFKRACLFIGSF